MRRLYAVLLFALAASAPALGFDAATLAAVEKLKDGRPIPISRVATLMMNAERWCYQQVDNGCAWSDVYLSADDQGARFEISTAWTETERITYFSEGVFRDGRFICGTGIDWSTSVVAYEKYNGRAITGRALDMIRAESATYSGGDEGECFDYLFVGMDEESQTISLVQRLFLDGQTNADDNAEVTLYFDAVAAERLEIYW